MPHTPSRTMSAAEAAEALQVRRSTLYSYVSRGLLRSLPDPKGGRARRYPTREVERLRARGHGAHGRAAADGVLHFGEPVLSSELSLIEADGLWYRGRDAIELAGKASLEQVARWLWLAQPPEEQGATAEDPFVAAPLAIEPPPSALNAVRPDEAMAAALPVGARADAAAWDLRPRATARTGARILRYLTRTVTAWRPDGTLPPGGASPLAGALSPDEAAGAAPAASEEEIGRSGETALCLQRAWLPERPEAAAELDMALVLAADHGLNVSSFVARCVASAQATPWAAVQAGLAALGGALHGGHTLRVTALLEQIERPEQARTVLAERLRRGEPVPGFGHPLYRGGDPRGRLLLDAALRQADAANADLLEAFVGGAWELLGERPTIDMGLVALTRALGLPSASPIAVFALGRTVGWIAHVLEQQVAQRLIRPRAHYVGPLPQPEHDEGDGPSVVAGPPGLIL